MVLARFLRPRCYHVARVLQSYLDGEVDRPTAQEVAEHLEECRWCGLEASTYAAIKTAIASSAPAVVPALADVDPRAVTRLRAFAASLADPDGAGPAPAGGDPRDGGA